MILRQCRFPEAVPARIARWLAPAAIAVCVAFAGLPAARGAAPGAGEFWVAPGGSDANAGTAAAPFRTLTRARDAARVFGASPRRIVLKGGNYYGASLSLGAQDSGLTLCAAPGEQPTLYGGTLVRNWRKDEGQTFSAAVPGATGEKFPVRCLIVDGERRAGARFPSSGTLTNLNTFKVRWMSTTGGGWERPPTAEELRTLRYQKGDIPMNADLAGAEVTIFHKWDESRVGIESNDPASGVLRLSSAPGHPPGAFGAHGYVIWNTREGLNHPGQWYNDRAAGKLTYWPLEGEKVDALEIVVPSNASILRIKGGEAPARDIVVDGLGFCGTTVPSTAGGFAAEKYDGAVSLANAEGCVLRNLKVSVVGGHGIKASGNNLQIVDCVVRQSGAGGIYAHGNGIVISNNLVAEIGLDYPSSVGIMGGHGKAGVVAHNEVHDCPYSAFCFGGATNLVIEGNLVYDCMKVLGDGAAFYLFAGVDAVIRGNVARDFRDVSGGSGASAYYLDERSTGCVVEQNISLRVTQSLHNHMATNNSVRNNILISAGDLKLTFPKSSGYVFGQNILQAAGAIRIDGVNAISQWGSNLFWTTNAIRQTALDHFKTTTVTEGLPPNGVLADPQFRDGAQGDVSLASESPAYRTGFKPFKTAIAGRR